MNEDLYDYPTRERLIDIFLQRYQAAQILLHSWSHLAGEAAMDAEAFCYVHQITKEEVAARQSQLSPENIQKPSPDDELLDRLWRNTFQQKPNTDEESAKT